MAFNLWIDDANLSSGTNVQSAPDFSSDAQRSGGFSANQPSSAIRVNSALRQSNLVVCALMDALNITDKNLLTTRSELSSVISNKLNTTLSYIPISGTSALTGSIVPSNTNSNNLGSSQKQFSSIYGNNIYVNGTDVGSKIISHDNQLNTLNGTGVIYIVLQSVSNNTKSIEFCRIGKTLIGVYKAEKNTFVQISSGTRIYLFAASVYMDDPADISSAYSNLGDEYKTKSVRGILYAISADNTMKYLGTIFSNSTWGIFCDLENAIASTDKALICHFTGYNNL